MSSFVCTVSPQPGMDPAWNFLMPPVSLYPLFTRALEGQMWVPRPCSPAWSPFFMSLNSSAGNYHKARWWLGWLPSALVSSSAYGKALTDPREQLRAMCVCLQGSGLKEP